MEVLADTDSVLNYCEIANVPHESSINLNLDFSRLNSACTCCTTTNMLHAICVQRSMNSFGTF